jgi:hypothetical protein
MLLKGTMKPYSSITDRQAAQRRTTQTTEKKIQIATEKVKVYDNPAIGLDAVGFGAERFICY